MALWHSQSLEAKMQQEAERKVLPDDMPPLPEVPAGRYCDPAFYKLEVAAMKRSWLFGIHGDDVLLPGCFRRWDHLGQPLVFVCGNDNRVRCYYNICRHRGSAIVIEECGQKRNLTCPIHGWTYRLDGALVGLTERRDFSEADLQHRALTEVRCENIGELYFINVDGNARPLLEDLGPIADAWAMYRPDQSRLVTRVGMKVNANYKVVHETNLEVYHVDFTHAEIVSTLLDSHAAPIELYANGQSIQAARLRKKEWTDSGIDLPRAAEATPVSVLANVSFQLFPNRVLSMNDWGYPIINCWPLDERSTYVEVVWVAPKTDVVQSEALWNEIITMFNVVLQQDYIYCPTTQTSMESGACRGVLLGAAERAIYNFHEEMDRRIGIDRVPHQLRVRPVLENCLAAA